MRLIKLLLQKLLVHPRQTFKLIVSVKRSGLNEGIGRSLWELLRMRKAAMNLWRLLHFVGERFDVVHLEDGWVGVRYVDLTLHKHVFTFKTIGSCRGADLFMYAPDHEDTFRRMFSSFDGFHFVSRALLARAKELGLEDARAHVIPPGTETGVFKPSHTSSCSKSQKQGPLLLLSVGRLVWAKGYEYALQALSILVERGIDVRYEIVGEGNHRIPLQCTIREMALGKIAHLPGRLPRDGVFSLFNQAEVYVHPSVSEGFGNAVLEAQSFEIPVVCTSAGGLPEAVEDGVTGFVVPPRDPEALAEKIETLAKEPELRRRMGIRGRARVQKELTLEHQAQRFLDLYKAVAEAAPDNSTLMREERI